MSGTSKVVEDILTKFKEELEKNEKVSETFLKPLIDTLNDPKKVTAAKLEKVLYPEDDL